MDKKRESKPNRAMRELDYRKIGRLMVTLYWHKDTDSLSIDLRDKGVNIGFVVEKHEAKDAFDHPYPYAYQRGLLNYNEETYHDGA